MDEIKRIRKTMPNFKTNSPHDFFEFDYRLSYFLPETQEKIEDAVNRLYVRIGKILEDDRVRANIGRGE